MTNIEVKITGINLVDASPSPKGDLVLCLFDAETAGLALFKMELVRGGTSGRTFVRGPRLDPRVPTDRAFFIKDEALKTALADAAHRAYKALTGAA